MITSSPHPPTPSRWHNNAIWYAGVGVAAALLITGFVWKQLTKAAVRSAAERVKQVAEWSYEWTSLERSFGAMYFSVLQPPGGGWETVLDDLTNTQQIAERRFTAMREQFASAQDIVEQTELLQEFDQLEEPLARFSNDLLRTAEPHPRPSGPPGPPPREVMRARLQTAREGFEELNFALSLFSQKLDHLHEGLETRRADAEREHQKSDLFLLSVLGSLLVGTFALCLRFQRRSKVEARTREQLNEQLQAAETKYRSIFDNAVEGIFQTTPDGRFLTANNALARMYGYRSPKHLMESMSDIGRQLYAEPEQRRALLQTLQRDDAVSNLEIEIVRADGRTMWMRENVRAVRDAQGQLLFLEGTVEDISDRHWSEQRRLLQAATSQVLENAASVAEARPLILQTICELLSWDMGAVWDVGTDSAALECVEVWHAPHIDITEFEDAVSGTQYRIGQGLAGEVWESGEPKWIENLTDEAKTPGMRVAVMHGMGSAFGVPIKVASEVRHVVEFFSPKISLPDPELLQTLGLVASQIGQLIERKGAEEALRKSEVRKAAILHSALDCILSFDLDGRIVEFNPAAEKTFGIRQVDALDRNIIELLAPTEVHQAHRRGIAVYNAANVALSNGRRVELTAVHCSGREFPVEVSVSRTTINGAPMFTAFLRDISERKQAEELTSELAAVVANSNDAIVGCTINGVIRSWNTGAERTYGWSAEEAIGRSLEMLIPQERLSEYPKTIAAVRSGESLANYETIRLRKDGKKISVSITDSPIRSEDGLITGLSSIARDITERKRLEEELLQSQKMEAVGRLAGGIAHDFNNILTAILGYSDLLIGQIEERHWMYRHLSEIRKAADFAASLTHQLLAFSRRQPLFLRVFSINDTVRNLHKMLERVIGERVKIRTELGAEVGRLKADPGQLEQVLLNLCVNARDAMPNGGTITVSTADVTYHPADGEPALSDMPAGEYVRLTVTDTGMGISPDVIKHIFEPFFTTKEKGQGTGLGLATCYGIVKQSGGYIMVDSMLGVGTSFRIYLPRVDESGEKAPVRKGLGQLAGGSEIVLYVEDEVAVRSLTAHVLRQLGYTVLEAGDTQQAKTLVEGHGKNAIDMLFCDVVLPDGPGRELADWLTARRPGIRVLFTSGYVDEKVLRNHGIDASCAFLQKPFTPADLARQVRDVIDGSLSIDSSAGTPDRRSPSKASLSSGLN